MGYQLRKKARGLFKDGRNIGLQKRSHFRTLQIQIYFLLEEFRNDNEKIQLEKKDYEELVNKIQDIPFVRNIQDEERREEAARRALDFAIYKLMLNGDVVLSEIEKIECLMLHKDLIQEARDKGHFSAAISGNRDLMEHHGLVKKSRDDGTVNMFAKLRETKDGKEAIMIGTSAECISMVRKALFEGAPPKAIEMDKEEK